jgi:murein DD-endopeptidase MepM/ murein hydrolase activator NlpD
MVHPTLKKGVVTSPYGWRSIGWHGGIDFAGLPIGTPIYSSYAGKITSIVTNCPAQGYYCSTCGGGGGNWVEVTSGNIKTRYMHLNHVQVSLGQSVNEGQQIGTLGNSGCTTAPHLHYELWINGKQVDPAPYLQNAGITPGASNSILKKLVIAGLIFYFISYE